MRRLALVLSLCLFTAPAFAKTRASSKGPRAGAYCSKSAIGTTAQDAKGASLQCKADKKGKARWSKQ